MVDNFEQIEGNPWTLVPIQTRKYAKECTELVMSGKNITRLINFDNFENVETLFLNKNKLEAIEGLDKNIRIKYLSVANNSINTLEGSLKNMKFLKVLHLQNNKLRNLEEILKTLKNFSFLEELNLFGNPISEEPEYRNRVIYFIPSLQILDRHKITEFERNKCSQIVKEFYDPLSKKEVQKKKIIKAFENFSPTEKDLFKECNQILKRKEIEQKKEKEIEAIKQKSIEYPDKYIPFNPKVIKNSMKYSKEFDLAPILSNKELFKSIQKYILNNEVKKQNLLTVFLEFQNFITKNNMILNDKVFYGVFLEAQSSDNDFISFNQLLKYFDKILKANTNKKNETLDDLEYLQKLNISDSNNNIVIPIRSDVLEIKAFHQKSPKKIYLNNLS